MIKYLLYYVYFLEFFTHENLFSKVFKSQNSIYNSQGFLVSIKIQVLSSWTRTEFKQPAFVGGSMGSGMRLSQHYRINNPHLGQVTQTL